jgi:hypothetical protein
MGEFVHDDCTSQQDSMEHHSTRTHSTTYRRGIGFEETLVEAPPLMLLRFSPLLGESTRKVFVSDISSSSLPRRTGGKKRWKKGQARVREIARELVPRRPARQQKGGKTLQTTVAAEECG